MTEERIRDLLREMREEPLPPDSLARVRLGVASRIQARSGRRLAGLRWRLAGALLAITSLALVIVWRRAGEPIIETAAPVVARQPPAAPAVAAPPSVRPGRPAPRLARPVAEPARRTPRASPSGGALLIRIETSDPDVVILLVGEGEGS